MPVEALPKKAETSRENFSQLPKLKPLLDTLINIQKVKEGSPEQDMLKQNARSLAFDIVSANWLRQYRVKKELELLKIKNRTLRNDIVDLLLYENNELADEARKKHPSRSKTVVVTSRRAEKRLGIV